MRLLGVPPVAEKRRNGGRRATGSRSLSRLLLAGLGAAEKHCGTGAKSVRHLPHA